MINYIQQKREDKEQLESKVENLKGEIRKLEKVKSESEERFVATKNKIGITSAEIDWYISIKDSLEKEGIAVEDISLLSRLVTKIKKYGNNNIQIFQILKRIENIENLEKEMEIKKRKCKLLKTDIEVLEEHDTKLLDTINSKILKLDCLDEIEKMGFNFADLKKFKMCLIEIAVENKMNQQEIKEEFFDRLSQYAYKIIVQKELERLNKLIPEVEKLLHKKRSNIAFQGMAEKMIQNLVDKGMDETDIILLNDFIQMVDEYGLKPKDLVEFVKWVRVQYRLVPMNGSFNNENLKLNVPIKSNNNDHNIIRPYPFCEEENTTFVFHPLSNRMYSIPKNIL